ncbi:MAG: metallophosphoesterase [Lentisphaerae bacterium]|nr:metallophosphoesterase [Lentisphaerota bacterium]
MRTLVISDLHLGDRHSRVRDLATFLERLPAGSDLVLNGDVMDRARIRLRPPHQRVLDLLRAQSLQRRVIWVRGNHDETFTMPDPGGIVFCERHAIDNRLLVLHGHDFENIMPVTRPLLILLNSLHMLRILLGAESMHVAQYAKRFPALYRVLCRRVTQHAVAYAQARGFTAVTCGHTHFRETVTIDRTTYYNTGAWTEPVTGCLDVTPDAITLVGVTDGSELAVQPGGR